jgi:heme iron utilization protein
MAEAEEEPKTPKAAMAPGPEPGWQARQLLRAARSAALATQKAGQPYASLVTPACAADGSVLMLLSQLSEHTRQLRAEPRCSLMAMGEAAQANPQTAPRVTIVGVAEQEDDPALKARWLAIHPYARMYAEFADFSLWRLRAQTIQLVGGFARAFRLKPAEIAPDPAAVATILAAEPDIVARCNRDHAEALAWVAGHPGAWHVVALDADGCDLAVAGEAGEAQRTLRIAWSSPADGPDAVRRELARLAEQARDAQGMA